MTEKNEKLHIDLSKVSGVNLSATNQSDIRKTQGFASV